MKARRRLEKLEANGMSLRVIYPTLFDENSEPLRNLQDEEAVFSVRLGGIEGEPFIKRDRDEDVNDFKERVMSLAASYENAVVLPWHVKFV